MIDELWEQLSIVQRHLLYECRDAQEAFRLLDRSPFFEGLVEEEKALLATLFPITLPERGPQEETDDGD